MRSEGGLRAWAGTSEVRGGARVSGDKWMKNVEWCCHACSSHESVGYVRDNGLYVPLLVISLTSLSVAKPRTIPSLAEHVKSVPYTI